MLKEEYNKIYNNKDSWLYYSGISDFKNNPFESSYTASIFISNYFKAGGKDSVLASEVPFDKIRVLHSISTFFLGLLIKPILKIPELKPDFKYLWFITALYHDFGYYFENDKSNYDPKEMSLKILTEKLKISYNIFDTKYYSKEQKNIIFNYYDYCRNKLSFINHGIIGGLLLYDKLKKNYAFNKNEAKVAEIDVSTDNFKFKELNWSSEHDQFYKYAANAIIMHNIWFAHTESNKTIYRKNDLSSLIIHSKDDKLKMVSNPFLFLLLITDAIEPIKEFKNISHSCVINKIDIQVHEPNQIICTVKDKCLNSESWFAKLKDLENWLSTDIQINLNQIIITIL